MAALPLRVLVIGAHPDDSDIMAGGLAGLFRRDGHVVKFVSVTNGESGHHQNFGPELVEVRRAEAAASGQVLGIEYDVLDFRDGQLAPTFEARCELIRLIRRFEPDIVLTHRPNDYHPDHRYTSVLVCDAAYMVTVPAVAPDVPHLRNNPAIAYVADHFQKPYPFSPRIAFDIEPVIESVVDMLHCHKSQFYEWLAYNHQYEDQLPADDAGRREWLGEWYRKRIEWRADRFRDVLLETYGEAGRNVRWVEAIEPCEYGGVWNDETLARLFPFAR